MFSNLTTGNKQLKLLKQRKKWDFWVLIIPLILSLFGILMIYEASNVSAFRDFADKYHYVKDQFNWLFIGLIVLTITSFIEYKKYYFLSVPIIMTAILSLLLVLVPGIGVKALGAKRWINLGSFNFQPSELTKLAVIIYLSSWFAAEEKKRFFAFLLLFSFIVGLVAFQPDLGTAVILSLIFLVMYFLSEAPLLHFFILIPIVFLSVAALTFISPYRMARLTTFFNPNIDPLGSSYHIRQILIGFGSGGLWGVGLGASRQKYQFLPEATTDSIFAIIGEEFGFIGAIFIISIFVFFLYKIFNIIRFSPDKQSFLLSGGIFTLFAVQILINLGSMVVLFPLTGVPLPFLSYGGSSLIMLFAAVGILLNISKNSVSKK